MRQPVRSIAIVMVSFLAATGIGASQIGPGDRISVSGVGAVKFGMTLAQAAAAGVTLVPEGHVAGAACFYAQPAGLKGLTFMIRGGQIVRADMAKPANLKTVDGFKRGDREVTVVSFYAATSGGASDFPLSDTSDVTLIASPEFSSGEGVRRLVYEITDAAGVIAIHAGWVPRDLHGCAPNGTR
jgi:hypothetical protein